MLRAADTVGVFQVESRAQMATLPRMKPERFYDLVVEVAIIRPGPIVGKMVNPYLERRNGRERGHLPAPVAGADPEAHAGRAAVSGAAASAWRWWRPASPAARPTSCGGRWASSARSERMNDIETDLRAGMAKNGITGAAQEEIVQGIKSFALYGFPESHAASFALLAYASAYLKAHHPAAFLCALLNNWPMGFYHPSTLVTDAVRHGVERPRRSTSTRSGWLCDLEDGGRAVRLGLRYVRGLHEEVGRRIEAARRAAPFASLADFARAQRRRTPRELATLAEIGALAALGGDAAARRCGRSRRSAARARCSRARRCRRRRRRLAAARDDRRRGELAADYARHRPVDRPAPGRLRARRARPPRRHARRRSRRASPTAGARAWPAW